MFTPGNVLHGIFDLGPNGVKPKFSIVLYKDDNLCIVTTFTTSQKRSSVASPVHGRNPKTGTPISYVFKSNVCVGEHPINKTKFSFYDDTTVVGDYGFNYSTTDEFESGVINLTLKCKLYPNEYEDLVYTLYKSPRTPKKYKLIYEKILEDICE